MNQIIFGEEAREKLKAGVDQLANAVKVTFGGKGRNVIIKKNSLKSEVTKDGVTVARAVVLNDPIESIGADLVKDVAILTDNSTADGTTTSVILTQAIIQEGSNLIKEGDNLTSIKKGIDKATIAVVKQLQKISSRGNSNRVQRQIATVSANGDKEIGNLIADTLQKVGKEGIVTVEESSNTETSVEFTEGMTLDNGYMSPYFVTNREKQVTDFKEPLILLYDGYIQNIKELVSILTISVESNKPLLIIAEDVESETLKTLAYNCIQGELKIACVKAPGFGDRRKELFQDIAALTGGTLISKELGQSLSEVTESMLGQADKITIDKEETTIIGGFGEKEDVKERVDLIKSQIESEEKGRERTFKELRLAKLTGGAALIKVGGYSEVEIKEKKDRIDDALGATRAVAEEGFVVGGGVSYIIASYVLKDLKPDNEDEKKGIDIIKNALTYPSLQILENAGMKKEGKVEQIKKSPYGTGYNVVTETLTNLLKEGIIDPTKVSRVALENASSISSTFLATQCLIYNEDSFM